MPPTRSEAAPAEEAAAPAAAAAAAAAAPASGGFAAWLPLLATILVMPVLAYLTTTMVLLPKLQKGLNAASPAAGGEAAETAKASGPVKKESVTMNKLLVNVAGTMGSRYLLISLTMVGAGPQFKEKVQDLEPQLRDMACGVLQAKTLADLEKPTARNLIRSELIAGFNTVFGGATVQEIYFTEFAIQ
ncbi:MAG: flagellar basal body-associated FliL family protein [Verrucomicrobiota bacterium]